MSPNSPSDADLPEQELLACARAGDPAARLEAQRRTLAKLGPWLGIMAERLFNHAHDPFAAATSAPVSPDALMTIGIKAIPEAIDASEGVRDWVEFSIRCVATAMWRAVVASFEARTRAVAEEAIKSFKATPEVTVALAAHISAVVAAICAEAPRRWLLRVQPMGWEAYALSRVDEHFRAIAGRLAGPDAAWELTAEERGRIRRIADSAARRFSGTVNESLADDLEQIALDRVARALPSYDPKKGPRLHFVLKVAKHAVCNALDPARSHNFPLLWKMIEQAMDDFRNANDTEPEVEDIVAALDPEWARKKHRRPRFSPSLVRQVIVMFAFPLQDAEAGPAKEGAVKLLEQLALRARLTEEERAILDLRLDDLSHDEIAARLNITPRRSRKLYHRTMKRLKAVGRGITTEERSVVKLKVCAEKSDAQVAKALGISVTRVKVLWHFAVEHILPCPAVRAKVSKDDWPILNEALHGSSHARISRDSDIPSDQLSSLLRRAVAKLRCVNLAQRRS